MFGERSFNAVDFQRPDRVRGSSVVAAFQLGGEPFFVFFSDGPEIRGRGLRNNRFFFDGDRGFLAGKACQ